MKAVLLPSLLWLAVCGFGRKPDLAAAVDSARPLVAALEREHAAQGRLPAQLPELATPRPGGWTYTRINDHEYDLFRKLGWDESIQYRFRDGRGQWIFDPGDGSPQQDVKP